MIDRPTYEDLRTGLWRLWNAVRNSGANMGHEGSELLEVMSEAGELIARSGPGRPAAPGAAAEFEAEGGTHP